MNDEALEKRRAYMREWKKNRYASNPTKIKQSNKNAYYTNRYGVTEEDKEMYGNYLGDCIKLRTLLIDLKEKDETVFNTLLNGVVA
tara:strand:- start:1064 stop:1321 length:258 start_codon:yes stop_codon:yes gene_type:complete